MNQELRRQLILLISSCMYPVSIAVIGALTVVYTYLGGIKAVIWVDAVKMGLYLIGCAVALFFFENWFQRVSMALPFLVIFFTENS